MRKSTFCCPNCGYKLVSVNQHKLTRTTENQMLGITQPDDEAAAGGGSHITRPHGGVSGQPAESDPAEAARIAHNKPWEIQHQDTAELAAIDAEIGADSAPENEEK